MKTHNVCALAVMLLALAGPAAATVSVRIDENALMDLRSAAGTVLIGNPAVADITLVSPRRIAILGRGYGATNVIITDRMGHVIFQDEVQVSRADANRVALYRGGQLSNFTCSPACQRTPGPGEDTGAYQPYAGPYKDHAQAAAAPSGGGGGGGGGGGAAQAPAAPQ